MCEHCGCQAIEVIAQLTREHDRALDHVRDVEHAARGEDAAAARVACGLLQVLLRPHTQVEEQALFPALAADFGEQMVCLVGEHRLVEAALLELTGPERPAAGWPGRLTRAMSVLHQHIGKEQDGVFPAALSTLTVADWDRVEQVRGQVGSALT